MTYDQWKTQSGYGEPDEDDYEPEPDYDDESPVAYILCPRCQRKADRRRKVREFFRVRTLGLRLWFYSKVLYPIFGRKAPNIVTDDDIPF